MENKKELIELNKPELIIQKIIELKLRGATNKEIQKLQQELK